MTNNHETDYNHDIDGERIKMQDDIVIDPTDDIIERLDILMNLIGGPHHDQHSWPNEIRPDRGISRGQIACLGGLAVLLTPSIEPMRELIYVPQLQDVMAEALQVDTDIACQIFSLKNDNHDINNSILEMALRTHQQHLLDPASPRLTAEALYNSIQKGDRIKAAAETLQERLGRFSPKELEDYLTNWHTHYPINGYAHTFDPLQPGIYLDGDNDITIWDYMAFPNGYGICDDQMAIKVTV